MNYNLLFHFLSNDRSTSSSKFINYFRSRNATTSDRSVALLESDLTSLGWKNPKFEVSKLYTFLEKKTDGTYWLNESKIQAYNNKLKQTNIKALLLIFIILMLIFIKVVL